MVVGVCASVESFPTDVPNQTKQQHYSSLGELPVMVCSSHCRLRGKAPEEMVALREEATECGGYFIVNGIERIIRLLQVGKLGWVGFVCFGYVCAASGNSNQPHTPTNTTTDHAAQSRHGHHPRHLQIPGRRWVDVCVCTCVYVCMYVCVFTCRVVIPCVFVVLQGRRRVDGPFHLIVRPLTP